MSANGVEQFFNGLEAYVREAAEKPAKEQAAASLEESAKALRALGSEDPQISLIHATTQIKREADRIEEIQKAILRLRTLSLQTEKILSGFGLNPSLDQILRADPTLAGVEFKVQLSEPEDSYTGLLVDWVIENLGNLDAFSQHQDRFGMPIGDLKSISMRTQHMLRRYGTLDTVGEVLNRSSDQLLGIENFGRKSLMNLGVALATDGFIPSTSKDLQLG